MEDVRRNREIETDGSGVRTERAVSSEPQVFYPEILTTTTSLLADKNIQKYTEVPVVFIKTEFDSKDTIIKKELDVEHGHFQQKPSMDTFLHIKQENSIIKTEVDTDEVIVKLELETSPTVLQPRTRPCSQLSPADVPTQMPSPTPCRGTVSDDPAAIAAPYPGSDTDSEYESGAPGPSTKKKSRTEIVHKNCVITYSRQGFKPSETQSTDNKSRRDSALQIIGEIVIEHVNNEMEVDDENLTIDHVQKPKQNIGVRLNKAPKTSAERGREFRARKALLKQQSKQQQEPDAIVEIATEDIRSAGPSEDNRVPRLSEIRAIEKRARSAEATRRWRERKKGISGSSKKQAKTAAQRMREYRQRKKLAKKILLKQQNNQDLDAIVSTSSSQVNQRAGPSKINNIFAELTRRGNSQSQR